MNIVIVGAGKMGSELCLSLREEGHDITLIEKNTDRLQAMMETCDILGVAGNGAFYGVQKKSNVADCDIFIATTAEDEINMISCVIAKKLGAKRTVARVRTPEYAEQMSFTNDGLGISRMINPDQEAAAEIFRVLQYPSALSIEPFFGGRVQMVELEIIPHSYLDHLRLIEFRREFSGLIACIVQHENDSEIPGGHTVLQAGDRLFVTGETMDMRRLYKHMGGLERIGSVMLIGGGRIARYLLEMHRKTSKHFKLIEHNEMIARDLAENFDNCEIILGDGTDQEILKEEHIGSYDCLIAMTGIDEENIILSMFANKQGVPRTITKINRTSLLPIVQNVGIQSIITPAKLGVTAIVRYIRSIANASQSSNIEALYRLNEENIEVMQFFVRPSFQAINIPLSQIDFKEGVLIALIVRQNELIYPTGDDIISPSDHILVVAKNLTAYDLNDILRGEE